MTLTSDAEFEDSIADMVALVARGDIAAFVIPGHTTLEDVGQDRFKQVLVAVATSAEGYNRKATVRWCCDPIGSDAASTRTVPNLRRLLAATQEARERAVSEGTFLHDHVEVEVTDVGEIPASLARSLQANSFVLLGAHVVQDVADEPGKPAPLPLGAPPDAVAPPVAPHAPPAQAAPPPHGNAPPAAHIAPAAYAAPRLFAWGVDGRPYPVRLLEDRGSHCFVQFENGHREWVERRRLTSG